MAGKEAKEKADVLTGEDTIYDPKNRLQDSKLYSGTCDMSGCILNVMIKKGPGIKKETYDIMMQFQHNTVIPYLNFYPDSGHGRLVIPPVGASFEYWIENEGLGRLVGEDGSLTPLFKTMIIDICDGVENLYQKDILIKNLSESNLYMAKEVTPRILLLVTEAEKMIHEPSKVELWSPVQEIIRRCYAKCNSQPNHHADRYIRFISNENFTVKSLKSYPENWDDFTKGEYMLSLIAANRTEIRASVQGTGNLWPLVNKKLPDELEDLLEYARKDGHVYNPKIKFDFINLIRDVYKHFDKLPFNIKIGLGGTKEGFIKTVERWCPTVWEELYDVIGWR